MPKGVTAQDAYRLYKLIWERFAASQMASAEMTTRTVEISAGKGVFRVSASELTFPGFTIVYGSKTKNGESESEVNDEGNGAEETENLPEVTKGEVLKLKELQPNQHFTQPPPRFGEASLVKTLEELGIGRPSTYAATVATIVDRKYIEKQGKTLIPTKLGKAVNLLLVEHFGAIVDVGFTAEMEEKLDQIEEDKVDWHGMLKLFYQPFNETLKKAEENMNKIVILSDQKCPECGEAMAIRSSRFGQFLGCIRYPECKTKIALTREGTPVPEDRPSSETCNTCGGAMLIRYGRYGDYLACSNTECKEQRPILKTTGVLCSRPGCGGQIVEKKSRRNKIFWGCSHYSQNQCTSAYWYPPLISGGPNGSTSCPLCGRQLVYKVLKRGDQVVCSAPKECQFSQPATGDEKHASSPPVLSVPDTVAVQ